MYGHLLHRPSRRHMGRDRLYPSSSRWNKPYGGRRYGRCQGVWLPIERIFDENGEQMLRPEGVDVSEANHEASVPQRTAEPSASEVES